MRHHRTFSREELSTPASGGPAVNGPGASASCGPLSADQEAAPGRRKPWLCPSAPASEQAILLGVVQPSGLVAFLKDRMEVSREFLASAATGPALETRFRFSSPCIHSACQQWANGGCSLPGRLAALVSLADAPEASLPNCSIRAQCRWFEQHGSDACRICPVVVTREE